MTPEQVAMVRDTWKQLLPIYKQVAEMFYLKLFEINPSLRSLFNDDMEDQFKKLMAVINSAVNNIDQVEKILPTLQKLGKRHVDYGVKNHDYETVAAALLWALEQKLGDQFTDDVKESWTNAYMALAGIMIEAADEVHIENSTTTS